ncbi:MAG: hypothetical protein MI862_26640 [Desulfobacterales bacterium]|nr:hypothetical protein [Desulfobacterales bacterium]
MPLTRKSFALSKDGFEIIKDGFARARFDLVAEHQPLEAGAAPFSFEGEDEEIHQESEEHFKKLFRCLSAATTQSRFFDFSEEGVLKNAVPLFDGVTIFANHRHDVTQWKGFTQGAVWDGKNQPNGVNAWFVLDRFVDPNLVRGVETGALKSASATVWFEFKKSHPDLKWFYDHLGTEVDGQIVRFIVTRIDNVGEMSIVWEGEDRHAKSFDAGETPENPKKGDDSMSFSEKFLTRFSLSGTPETGDVEAAVLERITGLESKVEALEPDAEAGRAHLAATREKAEGLYKAVKGEDAKESFITNVIQKADLETAQSFVDEYQGAVEDAVPLTCTKCGETLSRRSSRGGDAGDNGKQLDISSFKIS